MIELQCPKCQCFSGDTWDQCHGSCPMPMSPHYKENSMIPHRTIDKIGAGACAKSMRFEAHDAYAVLGMDLNDLCALVVRLGTQMEDQRENYAWADRLGNILDEAFKSNLSER